MILVSQSHRKKIAHVYIEKQRTQEAREFSLGDFSKIFYKSWSAIYDYRKELRLKYSKVSGSDQLNIY